MNEVECVWDARAELGEGVLWHADEQAVYWVDINRSQLHRLDADGGRHSRDYPGRPSAVVPCLGGGLLATVENGLAHIDPATHTLAPLLSLEADVEHNRFNDGYSDTRGQFWFGSMDDREREKSGRFYRMDRAGKVETLPDFGEICITNGPAFSCDGGLVYFTDTLERKIFRATLDGDGRPGAPQLFIDFSAQPGFPDGMCTDTAGGLWVCQFAGGRITRFDSNGQVTGEILLPVPNITKCGFGGPDLQTLYITTASIHLDEAQRREYPLSGGLFAVDTDYTGVAPVAVARPVAS